ncbi:efflux RND transporter permease subunit [Haloarcula pelagica]|uniref:efflux RND transporter permease subunit n=1 Tax=Haloarcula pelagica TaxID=3033389 RepID=UPI0024C29BF0|nr:MMPL family transporter [Halomicroarcula sp. YJ-61-S]
MNYQALIDRIDDRIVDDSRRVVATFLVVTLLFTAGLGNVSTNSGTSQFTSGLPAEQAFERVNEEFSPTFTADTGSAQLVQRGENVLSKEGLLRMLRVQQRLSADDDLRVQSTSSAAQLVAQRLDPSATTLGAQIRTVERASESDVDRAVRDVAATNPRFGSLVSTDFNREAATASATVGIVTHEVPAGLSSGTGQSGSSPLTSIQQRAQFTVQSAAGGSMTVFGTGVVASENASVLVDSILIVVPAAVLFILLFLVVAYRDLADLLLGTLSLFMAIVWTFGFMGLAGIPFSTLLIAVPPLLLAVGIDFGIHAVNRYREERADGTGIADSMRVTTDQLLVAFFIVTGTTVIGFGANLTSSLPPIRDFGAVAAIGMTFTFLIFGVFLPAAKVELDRLRERYPIPTLSRRPLGSDGSALARVLGGGVYVANRAPVLFVGLLLLTSAGSGVYATDVSTSFERTDFLPPEENPDFLMQLPEPFRPGTYTVTEQINFLDDTFDARQSDTTTIYLERPMRQDDALESIYRTNRDPPDSFVRENGRADATSILTVIQDRAARDPEFRRLVQRNDHNDNGVPDDNLGKVYDYLLDSSSRDRALRYIGEDYRNARIVYMVQADASNDDVAADTRQVAADFRYTAIATGNTVVLQAVTDLVLESAVQSLVVALAGTALFLMAAYRVLEGQASLGIANLVPIVVTVSAIAGTMRLLGIPFNAITATILAVTIGLGVDYTVHVTHRFADEIQEQPLQAALDATVSGTGGALLGSMLTTTAGIGVLALAISPALGQFGVLTAISIVYAFLTSVFVLPSVLVIWWRVTQREWSVTPRPSLGETDSPIPGDD